MLGLRGCPESTQAPEAVLSILHFAVLAFYAAVALALLSLISSVFRIPSPWASLLAVLCTLSLATWLRRRLASTPDWPKCRAENCPPDSLRRKGDEARGGVWECRVCGQRYLMSRGILMALEPNGSASPYKRLTFLNGWVDDTQTRQEGLR
jgi:hypothetical protein